jgi:peptidoglycan hydrolase CwlO-like protein
VSPSTSIVKPANQIVHDSDDKIKQLQNKLEGRTRDLEDKISQNDKLSNDLKHLKESLTDGNLNICPVTVREWRFRIFVTTW